MVKDKLSASLEQVAQALFALGAALAKESNNKPHRPELRRALAALLENIVLDPHGKDGVWCFTVHLKGACEAIEIVCKAKPESSIHRGTRPRGQTRLSEGAVAA